MLSQMSEELKPASTDLEAVDGNPNEQPFQTLPGESVGAAPVKPSQVDESQSQHTPVKSIGPPLFTSQQIHRKFRNVLLNTL